MITGPSARRAEPIHGYTENCQEAETRWYLALPILVARCSLLCRITLKICRGHMCKITHPFVTRSYSPQFTTSHTHSKFPIMTKQAASCLRSIQIDDSDKWNIHKLSTPGTV